MPFSTIEEALEDIRAGKMVIVCDDEDRENEGDLTMAAELVTADDINFMATHARGLICLPMAGELLDRLQIPQMVTHNASRMGTAFTASIEAREGISTGISAADRALTCRVAADEETGADDLVTPGHIFPLRARDGGVLERGGQTESAVDLCRLAGLKPAGVICEIMKEDGTMARVPDLEVFSEEHGVKMVTVEQLAEYRGRHESPMLEFATETRLPTRYGEFRVRAYEGGVEGLTHLALIMGEPVGEPTGDPVAGNPVAETSGEGSGGEGTNGEGTNGSQGSAELAPLAPLVRVHSSCLTGEALHSLRCDCGGQLEKALSRVAEEGEGVIVYLQQEGRGVELFDESEVCHAQDGGTFGCYPGVLVASRILQDLGLTRLRLVTDNPDDASKYRKYGIEVVEQLPLEITTLTRT